MRRVSKKRLKEIRTHARIRQRVFDRDGGCVVAGIWDQCFGPLTPHHLLKASQGGGYTEENLTTLCAHHNSMVEDHPGKAAGFNLIISGHRKIRGCP